MTNLERYFGIVVQIDKTLEPLSLEILEERAIKLSLLKGLDIRKFSVYYHKIYLQNTSQKKHFSKKIPIEERIHILDVSFKVNPKQRKWGSIRFFNKYVGHSEERGITFFDGEYELRRMYWGKSLNSDSLETELITFIEKDYVRKTHQKIKVTISPQPTEQFEKKLRSTDFHTTDIDIPLLEEVRINIREEKIIEHEKTSEQNVNTVEQKTEQNIIIYNNLKNANTMGDKYDIQTGFGVGPNAKVEIQSVQVINYKFPENFDFKELENELSLLKIAVSEKAIKESDPSKFQIAADVTEAELETKKENKDKNKILQYLAKGGQWLLDTAKEIGVSVAAEIIQKSMGI